MPTRTGGMPQRITRKMLTAIPCRLARLASSSEGLGGRMASAPRRSASATLALALVVPGLLLAPPIRARGSGGTQQLASALDSYRIIAGS